MCITVIEILFLISGLWLLISGKIPDRLFQVMFGKGEYWLSPLHARLLGLLLVSPWPLVFAVSFALAILTGQNQLGLLVCFETVYDIVVATIAIIIARRSKKPAQQKEALGNNPS
ncbi:MAG: hypothetical protein ACWGPS_06880 [Candidatus Promineifilaceae bacterium]